MSKHKTPKLFTAFVDCLRVHERSFAFSSKIACPIRLDGMLYALEQTMIKRMQTNDKHQLAEKPTEKGGENNKRIKFYFFMLASALFCTHSVCSVFGVLFHLYSHQTRLFADSTVWHNNKAPAMYFGRTELVRCCFALFTKTYNVQMFRGYDCDMMWLSGELVRRLSTGFRANKILSIWSNYSNVQTQIHLICVYDFMNVRFTFYV